MSSSQPAYIADLNYLLAPVCQSEGSHWVSGDQHDSFVVTNPANGDVLAQLANHSAEDTRHAIDLASAALPAWQKLTAKARSVILRQWFNLINQHADDLALLMTLEQGKPLAEAKGEVLYGASFIEWFAEEAKRTYGDVIPSPQGDRRLLTIRQSIGVVAAITPWNFPNAMITRKVAPALAAGCTVVIKPSEETPLSAIALANLAYQAGVPRDALHLILSNRAAEVGNVMCEDSRVRKLTFTGSTPVGKILMRQCADTVKKLGLELGGNAPFIVFDDADLDAAVSGLMLSKFRNAGQTCVCANRILVQDSVYDAFVAKLKIAVEKLQVGNGTEAGVTTGPLINSKAIDKVERLVNEARAAGAEVITGGQRHAAGAGFYQPTLVVNATADMSICQEEIFGPVAPLVRFSTEEEAVRIANDTPFGLAAYFYSRDIGRIWRVGEGLEYGMVGINEGGISNEVAPFGGVKESGLGREGSKYGIEDFMEIKYLCMGGI
ncbi:succinate-semialdehyde dehydrogenase (NADP(+)) [Pokkaliibacter plantistimulans]|uniref:Succinate-semialdehyde dehydrogenase (NADP(+)) n=1 Tax=Proteobacteria bacterium 228 TaxID=2083153 RepID=A0A2S5KRL6_9PROT|nr:NAD-dependent succinate-semialdehyde dehydrogenase [Pokkaliibacter plantistimulans]PPC77494.1 succinate-semialdehyde dehydrogenase (NADP(+)) [Pokkaliibacter plantistimulans]